MRVLADGTLRALAGASLLALAAGGAAAEPVAVVIQNTAYRKLAPIEGENATDELAARLAAAGFNVIAEDNATSGELLATLRLLRSEAGAEAVVVFFSGYARQLNGKTFLLPTTADPRSAFDMLTQAIDLGSVRDAMRDAGGRLSIAVIDGAYPEPRLDAIEGLGPGMGEVSAATGEAIILGAPAGVVLPEGTAPTAAIAAINALAASADEPVAEILARIAGEIGREPVRAPVAAAIGPGLPGTLLPPAAPTPAAPTPAAEPDPDPVVITPSPSPAAPGTRRPAPAAGPATQAPAAPDPDAQLSGEAFEGTLTEGELRLIQIALRNLGLYRGGIDAAFGPQTREAILIFQRSRGYVPTGYLRKVEMLTLFDVGGV